MHIFETDYTAAMEIRLKNDNSGLWICGVLTLVFIAAGFAVSLGGCCSRLDVKPLFKDAAIQDSLQVFLERIDSVPNQYKAPSLYVVCFNLRDQDSLIRFGALTELWSYFDFDVDTTVGNIRNPHWIGLYQYGKKNVLVESDWNPSEVINLSVLGPWEEYESQYHRTYPMDDDSFYHENCEKIYLYKSPDSLRLISRRIGRPDPDFMGWPETIDYR